MPQYRTPGVYVHEVDMHQPAEVSISPSTTGFLGIAPRGKVNEPILVTSWPDFINKFAYGLGSPFLQDAYLSYSVFGFFNNGGNLAYIVRVTDGAEVVASFAYQEEGETPDDIIEFKALDPGAWGNKLAVVISDNTETNNYDVTIKYDGEQVEVFENVTMDETTSRFAENIINGASRFVEVEVTKDGTFVAADLDADKDLTDGADGGTPTSANFVDAAAKFDILESLGILVCPEVHDQEVNTGLRNYCYQRAHTVFFGDAEENATKEDVITLSKAMPADYRALYYPWIQVNDPIGSGTSQRKWVPVAGHVAGIASRIDSERLVYKAPAGTEAFIRGAIQLKTRLLDSEQGDLNKAGVNAIRSFTNFGVVVWGARTKPQNVDEDVATSLLYLNQRRGINFIKNWLKLTTQWAAFEPNNPTLWRKLTVFCKTFLLSEYEKGGLKGETAAESFFVKCDGEINTTETVKEGKVLVEVGVAIDTPGEFIIFRVGQWEGGSSVTEA